MVDVVEEPLTDRHTHTMSRWDRNEFLGLKFSCSCCDFDTVPGLRPNSESLTGTSHTCSASRPGGMSCFAHFGSFHSDTCLVQEHRMCWPWS